MDKKKKKTVCFSFKMGLVQPFLLVSLTFLLVSLIHQLWHVPNYLEEFLSQRNSHEFLSRKESREEHKFGNQQRGMG